MFLKKELKKINNKLNKNYNFITPILKRNNIVQIYWYSFLKNRVELFNLIGKVIKIKKKKNKFENDTLTLKYKIYNVDVETKFPLNNLSLVGLRVLKYY